MTERTKAVLDLSMTHTLEGLSDAITNPSVELDGLAVTLPTDALLWPH